MMNRYDIPADVLKGASRSFYLTIRVLPAPVRDPVRLAYLLARTADTIADTGVLPTSTRLKHLARFRARLHDRSVDSPPLLHDGDDDRSRREDTVAALFKALPRFFNLLDAMPEGDRESVQKIVDTLIQGMKSDLEAFPSADSEQLGALNTLDDLDRYTYLVAGCVGEFWTDVMMAHDPRLNRWDRESMVRLGVQFGKALQMTNILRDVPKDLRAGRCYIPREMLASVGLTPEDLKSPNTAVRARPLLKVLACRTLDLYVSAEQYILATPRRSVRLRLAMTWPVLIGLATLHTLLGSPNWLDPDTRLRVSRRWLYAMMIRSVPGAWSNMLFTHQAKRLRGRVEGAL